ncbi:11460_t:CDS:2 [Entrophospora sp. SA101]|nr:11460_t:CDS:2 [Entrophospora sp. SA101]
MQGALGLILPHGLWNTLAITVAFALGLVTGLWKCSDVHQLWTENLDAMAKDFAHNGIPEDKL